MLLYILRRLLFFLVLRLSERNAAYFYDPKMEFTMTRIIILIFSLSMSQLLMAQEEADTTLGWKNQIIGNLNMTQAAFDNWQQGGENSFAWQVSALTRSTLETVLWSWRNTGKFVLGYAKVGDQGTRKSSDEIKIESLLIRKTNSNLVDPYASLLAKTQFAHGFEYDTDGNATKISQFMDPGYFTGSAGGAYIPNENFQTRLGAAVKLTVADQFRSRYSNDERTRWEPGATSVTELIRSLHENILFRSQLELFANFKAFNQIDVDWENQITMTVTEIINVTFNLDLLYDRDISTKRQIRQVLAVGLTYTFL
jgi:hypothetical protein